MRGGENLPRMPLSAVVTEESAKKLAFGQSPDNSVMGPEDFASEGSTSFEVKVPDGLSLFELQVEAEVGSDRDQVFRITISDREDGTTRRVPVWGLAGDPQSAWLQGMESFGVRVCPYPSPKFAWRTNASG